MTTQQDDQGTPDERLKNLGLVVDNGGALERTLRDAFCSIIGNKYAAVVAAAQPAEWLLANCRRVLAAHHEITGEHRANILAALDACEDANHSRHELITGTRTASAAPDGHVRTTRTCKTGCETDGEASLPEDIRKVAHALSDADNKLFCAMQQAVSPEVMVIGQLLAWQQRRERER
jgi:hypothetical protein